MYFTYPCLLKGYVFGKEETNPWQLVVCLSMDAPCYLLVILHSTLAVISTASLHRMLVAIFHCFGSIRQYELLMVGSFPSPPTSPLPKKKKKSRKSILNRWVLWLVELCRKNNN